MEVSEGVYLYPHGEIHENAYSLYTLVYNTEVSGYYDFAYDETDMEVMDFEDIYEDAWSDDGYFIVEAPQTFIMPNHDVLFVDEWANILNPYDPDAPIPD